MPTSVLTYSQVLVGAQSYFAYAPYVAARGAATFVDGGSTFGGVTLDQKTTYHEVVVDQALAPVGAVPTKREYELKVKLFEPTIAAMQMALGQQAAAISGTTPNFTLKVDDTSAEFYLQLQFIGKGMGSTKLRTVTLWRCYPKAISPIPFKKDSEQFLDVTFGVLHEPDTGSTDLIRIVES